jgi:TonB-dependent receptor
MIRRSLLALLINCLAAVTVLNAQPAQRGAIEGRVFDADRGEYLENARITIEGTNAEVLTDGTGQFRLSSVAAGTVRVRVFFTGLAGLSESVVVTAGQTATHDFTFGQRDRGQGPKSDNIVKLSAFQVSSSKEMEGAAIAMNEQRFAKNIVNVLSAEEFGPVVDGAIGEFLKFIPGVRMDYNNGDPRMINLDGVPTQNVPVMVGGFDVVSTGGSMNVSRLVALDQVSLNNTARVEVNRSPTPDMSGSALAGSVNFVPRSAFERNRPTYSYSLGWMWKDSERAFGRRTPGPGFGGAMTYKIRPGLDGSAIVPVNKNFGFTVSAGYSSQFSPRDRAGMNWKGVATASGVATPTNPYLYSWGWYDGGNDTTRNSFATTIDWRPGPHDRLSFAFNYGLFKQIMGNRQQVFTINDIAVGSFDATHAYGLASTFPTTGSAVNNGNVVINNSSYLRFGFTATPSLRWYHNGPIWTAEAGASYGNSRVHFQDIDKGFFNGVTITRNYLQVKADNITYLFPGPGRTTLLDPAGRTVDPTRLDSYSIVSANSQRKLTQDIGRQAYFNVRRDLTLGGTTVAVKLGGDVRTRTRDTRGGTETYTWVGDDGVASTTPFKQNGQANDDSALPFLDATYSERIPTWGLPKQQHLDNAKLWADYKTNPRHWTRNPVTTYTNATNNSKIINETISALFWRNDLSLLRNRLKIVAGVRAEQTNIDAHGPLTDPTRNYQRDSSGKVLRAANGSPLLIVPTNAGLAYSQLTLLDRGYRAQKEYLRLFPSLNTSYNFGENFIGRFSHYESVGRPEFGQYAGGLTLPDVADPKPGDTIRASNASIKAWQARSYVTRLEYYFGTVGQLSAGFFIRDFTNFFQSVTIASTPEFLATYGLDEQTYGAYPVATQVNNPVNVRMTGLEVGYRHALTFLPNWARGIQVFANVTSQRAKDTNSLTDMSPFSANWGLSVTRPKWNLRINENYRGRQRLLPVTGSGIGPGTYDYMTKRRYIDVSAEYFLRRSLGLFVSARNLNGAPEDQKIYGPLTPSYARFRAREAYHPMWTVGIKGTL